MSENVPADLKYAKSHEWVRLEGDDRHHRHHRPCPARIDRRGVCRTAGPGRKVAAGEACAVVESVKTASDIYSPLSGEVVAVNPELAKRPELVNSEPYQGGWFFKLKLTQPAKPNRLLTPKVTPNKLPPRKLAPTHIHAGRLQNHRR
jgi:glycine cleavage system H protein